MPVTPPPHPRRRVAPSRPLPAGGVGSSWENRLGAAPPLGRRGKHLAGSPGGRRQHRRTYLVPEPSRLLPARPPLPTLARLPWTGPPSPGPRPCGAPTRTTCRKSGEAQTWAQAARPPGAGGLREEPGAPAKPSPGLLQPRAWLAGLARPPLGAGPSWKGAGAWVSLLEGNEMLGCPCPSGGLSFSVCQGGRQACCLPVTGLREGRELGGDEPLGKHRALLYAIPSWTPQKPSPWRGFASRGLRTCRWFRLSGGGSGSRGGQGLG